ncbi:protein of unknown function [Shewanella benthica]|uniref:Uncharacterized protein n=1 Tax=Shewanella benthica TaxID=43661 RepID=A0A330M3Z5_9GAMM|nr:protein of unknown function [Shewanella benthica]
MLYAPCFLQNLVGHDIGLLSVGCAYKHLTPTGHGIKARQMPPGSGCQ